MKPANRTLKRVQELFIDRDPEQAHFRETILAPDAEQPIFYISGENQIGKSWLLLRFYLECQAADWLIVYIDFSKAQGGFTSYLDILDDIRATLDQPFEGYQAQIVAILKQLQIPIQLETGSGDAGKGTDIAAGADMGSAQLSGQFAGRDIINIHLQTDDARRALERPDAIRSVTGAFLADLSAAVDGRPILFLFDDIGADAAGTVFLTPPLRAWLIDAFILPLCDELLSARFVLTQQDALEPGLRTNLMDLMRMHALTTFQGDREALFALYRTYLIEKQGLAASLVDNPLLLALFHEQVVKGHPAKLIDMVRFIQEYERNG